MKSAALLLLLVVVASACAADKPAEVAAPQTPATQQADPSLAPATTAPPPPAVTTTITAAPTNAPAATSTTIRSPPRPLEEDARTVVMAGLSGTVLDDRDRRHLTGGGRAVVLFRRNLESPRQVAALTTEIACAAAEPVIIAVDQEPGRVDRLATIGIPAPELDEPMDQFVADAEAMGRAMRTMGINLDLAPVADVADEFNTVLAGRSAGDDTEWVAARATAFIAALDLAGVGTTAKHFPGHGLSTVDPHRDVAVIDAPLSALQDDHFAPFTAAIAAGVDAVMVGHPIYEALDPDRPASLSPPVLDMLRQDFGFTGVAITDSLAMAALRKTRRIDEVATAALAAGQDMLLATRPDEASLVVEAIIAAVERGDLDRERVRQAADRVRRLAAALSAVECEPTG